MSLLQPLQLLRLDGGDAHERGDFRCTDAGCGWTRSGVFLKACSRHVSRCHEGYRAEVVRTGEAQAAYTRIQLEKRRKRQECLPVVFVREDPGGRGTRGTYLCQEPGCGWSAPDALRDRVMAHAASCHEGRASTVIRASEFENAEEEEDEEQTEQRREQAVAKRRHQHAAKAQAHRQAAGRPSVWPLAISDGAWVRTPVSACLRPGSGRRLMLGQLDELGQEAAEVAMTFISINIRNIRAWLSGQPPIDEPLQSRSTDVTVAMGSVGHAKEGPSAAACQALALASLVSGRAVRSSRIAVTGSIDLRGRIHNVGGVGEKVENALEQSLELLVIPAYNRHRLRMDGWSEELKAYASESVKGVKHFVDLLELTMDGFQRTDEMLSTLLDGPQVGVGRSMGGLVDGVAEFEVQCCYVSPGRQKVIKTGGLSRASMDAVEAVKRRVIAETPRIAEALGLPTSAGLRLLVPRLDLHVHVSHLYDPINLSYQMGAIYVAMVALMTGRRSRDDTLVFGNIDDKGVLVAESWHWTEDMFKHPPLHGVRRLVVGRGVRMGAAAKAAAEEEVEEAPAGSGASTRRKRMEVIVGGDDQPFVELLPLLFQ